MLLVHAELCFRAGMSIDWIRTQKEPYLQALTREIEAPSGAHLDGYLHPFIAPAVPRDHWLASVTVMPGLDGVNVQADAAADYADLDVASGYAQFERERGYRST